jgi:hypothetical protein
MERDDGWEKIPMGSVHLTSSVTGTPEAVALSREKSVAVLEEAANVAGGDPCGRS